MLSSWENTHYFQMIKVSNIFLKHNDKKELQKMQLKWVSGESYI